MTSAAPALPPPRLLRAFLQRDVAPHERLDAGLQGALRDAFPVTTTDGLVTLEFVEYMVEPPRYDAAECLRRELTFAAPLKVVVRLIVWEGDGDERHPRREGAGGVLRRGAAAHGRGRRGGGRRADAAPHVPAGGERLGLTSLHMRARRATTSWRPRAKGLEAILTKACARMDKAAAMGSVDALMPHDILNARPLSRAFLKLLEKSPRGGAARRHQRRRPRRPRVDGRARRRRPRRAGGFSRARWLTPSAEREGFAALSPDAPVREDGIARRTGRGRGHARSLAARLAGGDGEALARALPLAEAGAPMEGPLARLVAARGGALVLAERAGRRGG